MNFIYETPWWLPSGLLFLGVALFITGNNRLERKLMGSGVILAVLGIAIALVSYLLDSPREMVIRQTRALVSAAENRRWREFEQLLYPQVSLVDWRGRADIARGAQHYAEQYDLKDLSIIRLQAEATEPTFIVTMQISADFKDMSAIVTNWRLEWEKTDSGWLLADIEPQGSPLFSATLIERYFTGKPR